MIESVRSLLEYDAHSRRYQAIPDFVARQIGRASEDYSSEQLAWDGPRYDWINANLPPDVASAVELGSSLGHFSLRLGYERKIDVTGYEPVKAYAQVCNLFAAITGIEDRARFQAASVGIEDLGQLPDADALISLNVLHHAGNVFDTGAVQACGGWVPYAVEFLRRAAGKFRYLVFQTGNSVKGAAHFPSEDAVTVLADLLRKSGWTIGCVGVVTDYQSMGYRSFGADEIDRVPRIGCRRSSKSGLVEYRSNGALLAELPYGTLQRPLFFCRRS
jgi:hypothetical protein